MCTSGEIITYIPLGLKYIWHHITLWAQLFHFEPFTLESHYSSHNLVIKSRAYSAFQQLYSLGGFLYGTFVNQIIKIYLNKLKC